MAHFALVKDGIVQTVYVVDNSLMLDSDGVEVEALGQSFLSGLYGEAPELFVQCSYNGNMRGNYPGPDWSYDSDLDAFIAPKPFASWVLNEAFEWEAPVPRPDEDNSYSWDEAAGVWVENSEA